MECNGACVDVQSDPEHCGNCGTGCNNGDVCGGGQCIGDCDSFPDQCGGSCTNTDIDPLNCGDCGEACDGDQSTATARTSSSRRATSAPATAANRCCDSGFVNDLVCIDAAECP
jgi:hypothetical protein